MLIVGASGSGKSTLAHALVTRWQQAGRHAALVADDQTGLSAAHGALIARPHPHLAGILERRHLGLIALPALKACRLELAVELVPERDAPRLPDGADGVVFCAVQLTCLRLPARQTGPACLTLEAALAGDGRKTHLPAPPEPDVPAAPAAP